jgi:hypothetical protein
MLADDDSGWDIADFSSDFETEDVEVDVDAIGFRDTFCIRAFPPPIFV